jgi:hypothetical protein
MSICCANFLAPENGPADERWFRIFTTLLTESGPRGAMFPRQVLDGPVSWKLAEGARNNMAAAVAAALLAGGDYPEEAGQAMRAQLGWQNGYPLACGSPAAQFTFTYESCWLLPELVPVETDDRRVAWRDMLGPIHRTLDQIEVPVPRCEDKHSLAIIHAEDEGEYQFTGAAERLQAALARVLSHVDTYRGADFSGSSQKRLRCLQEVFHRHNAVLFLGHLRGATAAEAGGWKLSPDCTLTMAELGQFLRAHRAYAGLRGRPAWAVPELIFGNCCFSAGREPGETGLSYPKLFLDAGVRFFIGTWMDVVFNPRDVQGGLALVVRLAEEFFQRWGASPDGAVEHLYEAKRACGFHLSTALYQIYAAGGWQATQPENRQPLGPLIAGVTAGDRLGQYELDRELWADPTSRTFAARHVSTGGFHLVQVLADQLQEHPGLAVKLDAAARRLHEAVGKSEFHLLPDRSETVMLSRGGNDLRQLHVLVYDRPEGENADTWRALEPGRLDRDASDYFAQVLRLAAGLSAGLAELHAKQVLHGNFDRGSVVLRCQGKEDHVVIKDAWIRQAGLGRSTKARYAAPEELARAEGADQLKHDCWGLGVVLYELAVGRPPFDDEHPPQQGLRHTLQEVLGNAAGRVPTALDRVVRECLVPAANLRPSADFIARRLLLAIHGGGDYISDLESELNATIQAGHRLIAVQAADIDEMENTLCAMASHPHRNLSPLLPPADGVRHPVRYRVYVAAEGVGLVERIVTRGPDAKHAVDRLVPWQEWPGVPAQSVSAENAAEILRSVCQLQPSGDGQVPVVLLRGSRWWHVGSMVTRLLKSFQAAPLDSPVIIVCDDLTVLEENVGRLFVRLVYPPPAPAVLFERILGFRGPSADFPEVPAAMALHLAQHFYPCAMREVEQAMRLCALKHGTIDERALLLRDEQRERIFGVRGLASYWPVSKLPPPDFLGLPKSAYLAARRWVEEVTGALADEEPGAAPRRLLILGPDGCGKTSLARALGAWTGRDVVQIDPGICLRGGLGESEAALRELLEAVNAMHGGLVLLDDVDRFFQSAARGPAAGPQAEGAAPPPAQPVAAALTRMSSILMHWLDDLPPRMAVVSVAKREVDLPPEWRRRMDVQMEMPEPTDDMEHRCQVFAGLLRKFRLRELAEDHDLVLRLAQGTHPAWRGSLPGPLARRYPELRFGGTVRLTTGAAIEAWMKETITLFHESRGPVTDRRFWIDALDEETAQRRAASVSS